MSYCVICLCRRLFLPLLLLFFFCSSRFFLLFCFWDGGFRCVPVLWLVHVGHPHALLMSNCWGHFFTMSRKWVEGLCEVDTHTNTHPFTLPLSLIYKLVKPVALVLNLLYNLQGSIISIYFFQHKKEKQHNWPCHFLQPHVSMNTLLLKLCKRSCGSEAKWENSILLKSALYHIKNRFFL